MRAARGNGNEASSGLGGYGIQRSTTQENRTAAWGKANGGRGAGFGIGGPGQGANRNAQDAGWRDRTTQGTLLDFFTEPRPASQMSQRASSTIPWGNQPEGPDELPPPLLPENTERGRRNSAPQEPPTKTSQFISSVVYAR